MKKLYLLIGCLLLPLTLTRAGDKDSIPVFTYNQKQVYPHENLWQDVEQSFLGHQHKENEAFVCYPRSHRNFYMAFTGLIVGMAGLAYYAMRTKQRTNRLLSRQNAEITRQNSEISSQKQQIELINERLEHINKQLNSSITYARRIQEATLPPLEQIEGALPGSFVFFQPRDIVSGDFYWFSQQGSKIIIAAVDCTGHGVPGAFMSMIGNDLLSEIVNERDITEADKILNLLHERVQKALRQNQGSSRNDGMDMALCVIDRENRLLEFAGAKNPLYLIRQGDDEVKEIKGDKNSIGGLQKEEQRLFTKHVIDISVPTSFYLFTDGYKDQFGGPEGRKFMSKQFRELLFRIHSLPAPQQKQQLTSAMQQWQQPAGQPAYTQTDDMLVIGVQLLPELS